jgi:tetratricopeptide (TPR) repeat protein
VPIGSSGLDEGDVKPGALWTALLLVYIGLLQGSRWVGADERLDPLAPAPREVEHAIAVGRFADALPMALDLQQTYPDDPLVSQWLGRVYRGLDQRAKETSAWERFVEQSSEPVEACPAIAQAYEALDDRERALLWFKRCVDYGPDDPERLADLAAAWERAGDRGQALDGYRRASRLDPGDPALLGQVTRLSSETGAR